MTIQGALSDLNNLLEADDIPVYYKTSIKKIIETIEQELKTKWISVKDNMPIVGEEVLVCDLDGDMYITYLHTDGRWGFDCGGDKIKNVLAWQPLPEPYRKSEGN